MHNLIILKIIISLVNSPERVLLWPRHLWVLLFQLVRRPVFDLQKPESCMICISHMANTVLRLYHTWRECYWSSCKGLCICVLKSISTIATLYVGNLPFLIFFMHKRKSFLMHVSMNFRIGPGSVKNSPGIIKDTKHYMLPLFCKNYMCFFHYLIQE